MSDYSHHDFIDSFLEETADHLLAINRNLLALEKTLIPGPSGVSNSIVRINLIHDLFRSFHTLKGLSGMVGLAPAEELSHRLESVLKKVQETDLQIDEPLIDLLLEGARLLEVVTAGVKNPGVGSEDMTPFLDILDHWIHDEQTGDLPPKNAAQDQHKPYRPGYPDERPDEGGEPLPDPVFEPYPEVARQLEPLDRLALQAARQEGLSLQLFFFTPSAEKTAEGINVNSLRENLNRAARIIKAVPIIQGSGVQFAFITASASLLACEDFPEAECVNLEGRTQESLSADQEVIRQAALEVSGGGKQHPSSRLFWQSTNQAASSTVRVELERLDDLMRLVGDLVVARTRIQDSVEKLEPLLSSADGRATLSQLEQNIEQMGRYLRDLRQGVMRARMIPLAEVFSHMPLAVRELARSTNKEVGLVMKGEGIEIDKMMVERLLDPLLHLVRNAISHGIETRQERIEAGKPGEGRITLDARLVGDQLFLRVSDDGRGIDLEKVRQKAVATGIIQETSPLSSADILAILTRPGFTTLEEANLGAGRGMGMEVVYRAIKSIGGHMDVETEAGQGTTFLLRLPLTLTIVNAIILRCGEENFAVPLLMVDEVIEIDTRAIVQMEGGELFPHRDSSLALIRLADRFKIPSNQDGQVVYGLIGSEIKNRTALVVDQLIGMREVVVRPSSDPFFSQPGVLGATELGNGQLVIILDLPPLLHEASFHGGLRFNQTGEG
jgi:two-component system, chemotaxis family, sensor kinase CheA